MPVIVVGRRLFSYTGEVVPAACIQGGMCHNQCRGVRAVSYCRPPVDAGACRRNHVGVSILMKAVKVNKAFIGIENNKPDAIQLMTKVAAGYAGIEVVP